MARILVIDDEKIVRMAISFKLKSMGHEVLEAEDGITGIRLYQDTQPDLVLTDIVLPDIEGIAIIKQLKIEFPDITIVAMSGGAKTETGNFMDEAISAGAYDAFEKSFEWKELIEIVNKLFPDG